MDQNEIELPEQNKRNELQVFLDTAENADFKKFREILLQFDIEAGNYPKLASGQSFFLDDETRIKLYSIIMASTSLTFSEFIHELQMNYPTEYELYQKQEAYLYPSLGFDYSLIFQTLTTREERIRIIPPQYRAYIDGITAVKGTSLTNIFSATLAYAIGFSPYVLGNIVASQLTNVSPFARLMLSAAPTGMGGFARFWVANQVDSGNGKRAVMTLLLIGISGLLGLLCIINTIDLSRVKTANGFYWAVFVCNILSGAGVANYSASLPIAAQAAPNDSPAHWRERLQNVGVKQIPFMENKLARLLRQGPKEYIAITAGIGSLSPSITLLVAAFFLPYLGLRGVYAIFGAVALLGTFTTGLLLQNSVLDQVRQHGVPKEESKELARWMGQRLQSNPEMRLRQRIKQLDRRQLHALGVACFNYVTTFGILLAVTSTGTLTLSKRGLTSEMATYYTAAISGLSSLTRASMAIPKFPVSSSVITNFSLVVMIISSLTFALSSDRSIWIPMLFIFSVANGVGNYGVFAQIADTLSEVIGLASGLSGATGAVSAFFICIAFASLASTNKITQDSSSGIEKTDTAYEYLLATGFCGLSLFLNITHERIRTNQCPKASLVTTMDQR